MRHEEKRAGGKAVRGRRKVEKGGSGSSETCPYLYRDDGQSEWLEGASHSKQMRETNVKKM